MDEKTLAGMALQFLARVQLTPPEIDAFMAVNRWLRVFVEPTRPAVTGDPDAKIN